MTNEPDGVWLPVGQAAARLGTSPPTLKRLLKKEGIPVLRLNGHIRVRASDIDALLADRLKPIE